MTYKLMIIDDTRNRRSTYKKVFSEGTSDFEPVYVWTAKELKEHEDTPVDGYVVDVFLDTGDWGGKNAADLLNEFIQLAPRPAPVFLVSKIWGDYRVLEMLKNAGQSSAKVVQYLAWTEFLQASAAGDEAKDQLEALRKKFLFELNRWHGRSAFRPSPSDTIRILLIADPQFGDPSTARDATFAEHWIARSFKRNEEALPDLIVIAGDVSYSGTPDQFAIAEERIIRDLMAPLWGTNNVDAMRDRIVLAPGNHDVNLRFSSCDSYKFDFKTRKLERESSATSGSRSSSEKSHDENWRPSNHHDYALVPFRRFARQLTGDRNWEDSRNLCWVDRRFLHCGIRFFILNSVQSLNAANPDYASFDEASLRDITRSLGQDDVESVYSIAVSHHGLRPDDRKNEKEVENWGEVGRDFFALHRIRLWMYGHYHSFDAPNLNSGPFLNSPLWRVQAPTTRIAPYATTRGFCVIDLHRKDGKVSDATVCHHSLVEGSVRKQQETRIFEKG